MVYQKICTSEIAINYTANLAKEITERNIKEHQTWETYKKEMVDTFTDVNHRHKLKVRLLALKKTGSYAKFSEEFQYLSSLLNTSDEDKCLILGRSQRGDKKAVSNSKPEDICGSAYVGVTTFNQQTNTPRKSST